MSEEHFYHKPTSVFPNEGIIVLEGFMFLRKIKESFHDIIIFVASF